MADPPLPPSPPPPTQPQPTSSYVYPVRSLLSGVEPVPDADVAPAPESNVLLAGLRCDAQLPAERQAPTPKSSSPGLGARRGMSPQGLLGTKQSPIRESAFSAPLPTTPAVSSPTFFASQLTSSGSPIVYCQSAAADNPAISPPARRRVVSGLDQPRPAAQVTSQSPPSPKTFRHPADGRDGFHQPPAGPTPNAAEELSTASGMAVIPSSGQRGSKTSKTSASGTGTTSAKSSQVTQSSEATSPSEVSDKPLQHVQDEHGHYVVVGREGRLARCEDEPIRVPGAVQGFGVLIALAEDYQTGNLVVRQVSENASELLGLTPHYLFSLDCFTQTLPESQADVLWENVQFLHDPELEPQDTADDSPQVFLLSGWGEPGSALRDREYAPQGQGREWTCWCAAHRPEQPVKGRDFPSGSAEVSSAGTYLTLLPLRPLDPNRFDDDDAETTSPLIVLEFELERDIFNPLHLPSTAVLPIDSPGMSRRRGGSAPRSDRTSGSGETPGSSASAGASEVGSVGGRGVDSVGIGGAGTGEMGRLSVPTESRDVPTGIGRDAIAGTSAEEGKTGKTAGEGLSEAEIVVPVAVGRVEDSEEEANEEGKGKDEGEARPDQTTLTAVPTSTPAPEEGTVTSGDSAGSGTKGTVTDPSSEVTPTANNPGSGGNELSPTELRGLVGEEDWYPSADDVLESTTSRSRPLRALERMRRITRKGHGPRRGSDGGSWGGGDGGGVGVGTMDMCAVLAQVNDQLSNAPDLESFLKVAVGVIKDLTQFHRVMVYQFDDQWNGQCVAELVDWSQTHDIFKGLHFPAADIPAQARELYTISAFLFVLQQRGCGFLTGEIDKVRLLYDRSQTTARLVVRDRADLEHPLDMTHAFLRAMSPIHIKYLENMGARASMSISIVTFGKLWGLIACHSYGPHGMRVSFPVRQMLRLLSDSISQNVERLRYMQRLQARKLISTVPTEQHPTGYIVGDAKDLITLFDADFGVIVIGESAKILGPSEHGQETLIVAEYLRLKRFDLMQVSQAIATDFPDLKLPTGLDGIAGLLYVPLSAGSKNFIALMRKGQLRDVYWAGKPRKPGTGGPAALEPRKSFKAWKQTVSGWCRAWTDEQLETAGVLALVYGKFISVWRQKETVLKTNQLTNLLLSNANHEGVEYSTVNGPILTSGLQYERRSIISPKMALNGPLDSEMRENLTRSHTASRSLLFTINDLLDLTRRETDNETSNELFDLPDAIKDAVALYRIKATRRQIQFVVDTTNCPQMVAGDSKKIRTVVSNLTENAVKYTETGQITVECRKFKEPVGLRDPKEVAVEIVVTDTECGISSIELESIFREFEQVESSIPRSGQPQGLGLAVVARIVKQLGGQLQVDSKPRQGSRFSFLIPFVLPDGSSSEHSLSLNSANLVGRSRKNNVGSAYASATSSSTQSADSQIDDIVEAISALVGRIGSVSPSRDRTRPPPPVVPRQSSGSVRQAAHISTRQANPPPGVFEVEDSRYPVRGVKVDDFDADRAPTSPPSQAPVLEQAANRVQKQLEHPVSVGAGKRGGKKAAEITGSPLRILVVEDDDTNRKILCKRLSLDGHEVQHTTNGQEAVQKVESDREWDCVLMDIQMPILDGFGATKAIRQLEAAAQAAVPAGTIPTDRISMRLNGRIPIFAVSASLREKQREEMHDLGMDGWILKPIRFDRLRAIMKGITDLEQRQRDKYQPGKWEVGGWLGEPNPIIRIQH
ncbi:Light-sensor Protein kinase [Ceratobasidium sp. 428]|nr:Light-sensor Protein kinase [Ceratobasidium sp. 428]